MEENTQVEYQQYKEPVNYILAIIGALGGAAIGIAIWAGSTYFTKDADGSYSFYYITPIVVGGLAGGGATAFSGGSNFLTALIALIIGIIGVVLGDAMESAAIIGSFDITIDEYISFAQVKLEEFPIRYVLYLVAVGAAFFAGLSKSNNSEA